MLHNEQLRLLSGEIRDGTIGTETDWLEWKRELDLTVAKGRFEVSRQILGMANRVPSLARRNCSGYGYILVGVEQGTVHGMEQFDPAQLHDWINPYIGATGPGWQPRYIQADNTTVLAIEVEPPRAGDPIYTLKKSYESFDKGAIFVRTNGKTHPATPEDIENLGRRLQGARLDLDVNLIGDLPTSWFDKRALTATIKQVADIEKEAQLRRAWQTQDPTDSLVEAFSQRSRTMTLILGELDDRTIEQYTAEVEEWHSEWKERAPHHWLNAYAKAGHGKCSLSLTNLTDHNFTSVEVCLDVSSAQVITDPEEVETVLPKMPHPFGQAKGLGDIIGLHSPDTLRMRLPDINYSQRVWVNNDVDGAFVTWNVGDVRPEQTLCSDLLYVLVGEASSIRELSVDWRATSKSVSGVASGVFELPLSDRPVSFDDVAHGLGALDPE